MPEITQLIDPAASGDRQAAGFATQGRTDGEVGPCESLGRSSMPGGEGAVRLDEDAARASRVGAEESPDDHLEPDLASEGRFIGEVARVAAMNAPALAPAGGTGRVGVSGRDAEGEGYAVEVGSDKATANRGAQQLEQEQEMAPTGLESGVEPRGEISYLRTWSIKSAEEPVRKEKIVTKTGREWSASRIRRGFLADLVHQARENGGKLGPSPGHDPGPDG